MRPWGLPPKYGIYPISILERADVPVHLKLTYITLYALAWRTKHETVLQSVAQLAELLSQLEGKAITERGMRNRLTQLAKLGLIRRIFSGGRWMTRLLLTHQQGASNGIANATPTVRSATSIEDDDDREILTYQYQSSISGIGGASPAIVGDAEKNLIRQELWSMGIDEPIASELAAMPHVDSDYIDQWAAYLGYQVASGKTFGPGWLIHQIRAGRRAPLAITGRAERQ